MKWIPNFTHAPGPVEVQKFHTPVLLTVAVLYDCLGIERHHERTAFYEGT